MIQFILLSYFWSFISIILVVTLLPNRFLMSVLATAMVM